MNPVPLFLIIVTLPLLLGGCGEKPVEEAPINSIKYKITGDEVAITDYDTEASGALTIPATIEGKPVTSISERAFMSCISLTSITIPNSVTSIGRFAFVYCSSLTTIEVGVGNVNYTDVNGVLFNKEKTALLTYPAGKTGANYTIPDSVTSIGEDVFWECSSLTSITIPDSVTSIGDRAFKGCHNLTSITIPDSVTSIGKEAFLFCTSLTSITIPDSVTSIGVDAFWQCTNLTSITIGDSVTSIGEEAFHACTSLTVVTFLGDAPEAGEDIFYKATPTIYRKPKAKGWGDTFAGRPVKLISEKP